MTKIPLLIMPSVPRQLSIGFDPSGLEGMAPSERAKILGLLADLLIQAAAAEVQVPGCCNDRN
jgi:hypothetical protein